MARPSKPIKAYQALDEHGTLDVLRTARSNPDLRAGADYGEVGRADARVASYAVAVLRSGQERDLRRAFRRAMERHIQLPKNEDLPEVHLKELWSGQQRSRSRFSQLNDMDSLARFLLELAGQVRKIVPFSVVTIRPCLEAESKMRRASLLLAESLNRANICLALDRHEILGTGAVVLLDAGDGVALTRSTERGGVERGHVRELAPDLSISCDPRYAFADSSAHETVQVADFAGFVAGRMASAIERLGTSSSGDHVREYNLLLKLADRMNVAIDHLCRLDPADGALSHWEDTSCGGKCSLLRAPGRDADASFPVRYAEIPGMIAQGFEALRPRSVPRQGP